MLYLGSNGSKVKSGRSSDLKDLKTKLNGLINEMVESVSDTPGVQPLKKYSIWLHEFRSLDNEEQLSIPGELASNPAKISSFESTILVLPSLRKPKRIKILVSDESERYYLVKHGEDLRLDQRVQQTFNLMNGLMRKTKIRPVDTYNVIPLSFQLGLIEWLDNTKPLLSCLKDQLALMKGVHVKSILSDLKNAQAEYHSWFRKKGNLLLISF
jgi:DNA-dependent protein kinase catalytic subunit